MRYLHTMVRIENIDESLKFYCGILGMVETRRTDYPEGRFTLIYLAAKGDAAAAEAHKSPELELTYNWDKESYTGGRNFGHRRRASPLTARRVMAGWPLSNHRTVFLLSCCKKATGLRRKSHGAPCPISAHGEDTADSSCLCMG